MTCLAGLAPFGRTQRQAEEELVTRPATRAERLQQETIAALPENRPVNIFTGELFIKQRSKLKQN